MGINPKSPLENGLPLAAMSRKDQRQEIRLVDAELKEKLKAVESLRANNLMDVATRKQRMFAVLDEFALLRDAHVERVKEWIRSDVHEVSVPSADGKDNLKKNDAFTLEFRETRLEKLQQMILREAIIQNEIAKMPGMPEAPETGYVAGDQVNQQFNIVVTKDGEAGGYDAGSDFERFKDAKEAEQ